MAVLCWSRCTHGTGNSWTGRCETEGEHLCRPGEAWVEAGSSARGWKLGERRRSAQCLWCPSTGSRRWRWVGGMRSVSLERGRSAGEQCCGQCSSSRPRRWPAAGGDATGESRRERRCWGLAWAGPASRGGKSRCVAERHRSTRTWLRPTDTGRGRALAAGAAAEPLRALRKAAVAVECESAGGSDASWSIPAARGSGDSAGEVHRRRGVEAGTRASTAGALRGPVTLSERGFVAQVGAEVTRRLGPGKVCPCVERR